MAGFACIFSTVRAYWYILYFIAAIFICEIFKWMSYVGFSGDKGLSRPDFLSDGEHDMERNCHWPKFVGIYLCNCCNPSRKSTVIVVFGVYGLIICMDIIEEYFRYTAGIWNALIYLEGMINTAITAASWIGVASSDSPGLAAMAVIGKVINIFFRKFLFVIFKLFSYDNIYCIQRSGVLLNCSPFCKVINITVSLAYYRIPAKIS